MGKKGGGYLNTELKNAVQATDRDAQYDESAKRLLANGMNHIHLTNDSVLGSCEWKGKLDLLNIAMIGLANELPPHDGRYEFHRLLGALLSKELTIDEKLNIIGTVRQRLLSICIIMVSQCSRLRTRPIRICGRLRQLSRAGSR